METSMQTKDLLGIINLIKVMQSGSTTLDLFMTTLFHEYQEKLAVTAYAGFGKVRIVLDYEWDHDPVSVHTESLHIWLNSIKIPELQASVIKRTVAKTETRRKRKVGCLLLNAFSPDSNSKAKADFPDYEAWDQQPEDFDDFTPHFMWDAVGFRDSLRSVFHATRADESVPIFNTVCVEVSETDDGWDYGVVATDEHRICWSGRDEAESKKLLIPLRSAKMMAELFKMIKSGTVRGISGSDGRQVKLRVDPENEFVISANCDLTTSVDRYVDWRHLKKRVDQSAPVWTVDSGLLSNALKVAGMFEPKGNRVTGTFKHNRILIESQSADNGDASIEVDASVNGFTDDIAVIFDFKLVRQSISLKSKTTIKVTGPTVPMLLDEKEITRSLVIGMV